MNFKSERHKKKCELWLPEFARVFVFRMFVCDVHGLRWITCRVNINNNSEHNNNDDKGPLVSGASATGVNRDEVEGRGDSCVPTMTETEAYEEAQDFKQSKSFKILEQALHEAEVTGVEGEKAYGAEVT